MCSNYKYDININDESIITIDKNIFKIEQKINFNN